MIIEKVFFLALIIQISATKPNILLILTDDQDLLLKSLEHLPKIQTLLVNKGAIFSNAYTSSPICCPSRSSILTGLLAHNTYTFNNSKEGGCYSDDWIANSEPYTMPAILNAHGYETFFAGKYLNQYFSKDVPVGYDAFYGLHGNSRYYNYTLNENGNLVHYMDEAEDYLTNVIRNHAMNFLSERNKSKPFFALLSVPSCHQPFTPEDKYKDRFGNLTIPRTKNFNVGAKPFSKHWLMTMEPRELPDQVVEIIDEYYRQRLQTLLTVDDLVEDVVKELENQNILDDTYIIFTSDNGYHLGQWAMPFDKRLPYETDIKVPFIVRGPNVQQKKMINSPILLIDLLPTVLNWAKCEFDYSVFDGQPFDNLLIDSALDIIVERQMLIEYWGEGNLETWNRDCPWNRYQRLNGCTLEADCKCQDSWNNTYACIRHIAGIDVDFLFCTFDDRQGEEEAYDLSHDQFQLENVAYDILPSIRAKYQIAIENLRHCRGNTCRVIK